ncbi:MAG: hypothetical protein AB9869_35930 [Verrucomicrobiia bacterium]
MKRRDFLRRCGLAATISCLPNLMVRSAEADADAEILSLIEAHRPSRQPKSIAGIREQSGASHVDGKYHLTDEPFLLEGAQKLLELGTKVGKFWFIPNSIASSYPFNSEWAKYPNFVELAKSPCFARLFALPFSTIVLEAHTPTENGWLGANRAPSFYDAVSQEFFDLTAHLYKACHTRELTFVLQHWEGDWLLRGRGGELWTSPPSDWRERCQRMTRWLAARQAGVARARAEFGGNAKCVVAHAAEVNRVADLWKGIPTMTEHVIPNVELDLVSYSCYDGLASPLTLWKCIAQIKKRAQTTSLFGAGNCYIGEIGIPENDQPDQISERWDQWFGVCLAAGVRYTIMWQLYCNEFSQRAPDPRRTPVSDPRHVRGFWLVKPDGSLSETGRWFDALWNGKGDSHSRSGA